MQDRKHRGSLGVKRSTWPGGDSTGLPLLSLGATLGHCPQGFPPTPHLPAHLHSIPLGAQPSLAASPLGTWESALGSSLGPIPEGPVRRV